LAFHLHNIGRFTESQAKFYFSEVLLALEYLHSKNIIYNALSLEHILLDINGHVRLADFSCAKNEAESWIFFTLGQKNYGNNDLVVAKAEDFYKLGAMLYELLTRKRIAPEQEFDKNRLDSCFPRFLSREAKEIMAGLLNKDPHQRLGSQGIEEIKQQAWCQGIDWPRTLRRRIVAPFRPNLKSSNFDPEVEKLEFCVDTNEGDYIRGFDYSSDELDKEGYGSGEMMHSESYVPSERSSTDAEEVLGGFGKEKEEEKSALGSNLSCVGRTKGKEEAEKGGRSVSTEGKGRFGRIKGVIRSMTGLGKNGGEEERAGEERGMRKIYEEKGKMKETFMKKLTSRG
jgi:serine/threonine protein kinase